MSSHASEPTAAAWSRAPRVLTALWMLGVLLLWAAAHSLNRWVLLLDESSEAPRFAFWTCAKLIAWLVPTYLLLRRAGTASASWLGLTTSKGLGIALLWSVLWIGLQAAGIALQLPLFSRPPPELTWPTLVTSLLVAPVFEELMFRGAMLRVLRADGVSRAACVVVSALAFALLHVPGWLFRRGLDPSIAGAFVSMFAFGLVAGVLAWRVPTLWGPMLLHFANNFWSTGALAWSLQQLG